MARFFGVPMRNGVALGVASTLPMRGGLPVPALNLDFLSGALDSRITFTRGSTATYFDSTGTLQTAAINAARFDTNPSTLAPLGLLIEEQRTNSIRNNTMQGAVAGTPGTDPTNWLNTIPAGITQQIVGTGTERGITYIDYRFSGTATGGIVVRPDGETQVVASSGQAWTGSTYVRLIAGTLTNLGCTLNMRQGLAAGGLVLNTDVAFTPTTAALNTQRVVNAVASTQATTERIINRVILNATGAIDITLRIGLPQLEQGAFATSVIPTTTTALTRNADVADITGTNFSSWFNASEGTLLCVGVTNASSVDASNLVISDGTNNNRIQFSTGGLNTVWNPFVVTSGSSVATLTQSAAQSPKTNPKLALAYKVNDFAATTAGVSATTDTSGNVPVVNRLLIGAIGSGAVTWNSHIQRISYYPRRLPDSTLQALTA